MIVEAYSDAEHTHLVHHGILSEPTPEDFLAAPNRVELEKEMIAFFKMTLETTKHDTSGLHFAVNAYIHQPAPTLE